MIPASELLKMSPEERKAVGQSLVTPRWWDADELQVLASQRWFQQLRKELNSTGKLTINLGVLKYEQAGNVSSGAVSEAETAGRVRELFQKVAPLSRKEFDEVLAASVRGAVFVPTLVMLQGELLPLLDARKHVQLMVSHIAKVLGMDARARDDGTPTSGPTLEVYRQALARLCDITGDTTEIERTWVADPAHLQAMRVRGQAMIAYSLDTDGDRETATRVGFPRAALDTFPEVSTFMARILGWLERGTGAQLVVRAIAAADVYYFPGWDNVTPTAVAPAP